VDELPSRRAQHRLRICGPILNALQMVVEVPVMAAVTETMGQSAVVEFLDQWQ